MNFMQIKGQLSVHIHIIFEKAPIPGWTDVRHTVNAHSLYWIHSGKGIFTTNQEYSVHEGTLFYLRPGLSLSMKSDTAEPLRIAMVIMDCAEVRYANGQWGKVHPIDDLQLPFMHEYPPMEIKPIDSLFRALLANDFPRHPMNEVQSRLDVTQLLYELMLQREEISGEERGSAFQAYEQVKHYIEQHYAESIKIKNIAKKFGISESFLRKLFQRDTGESPKRYLNRIRHEHAVRLLTYTNEQMKGIAAACGYADEYHFSKMFKALDGQSPSAFRKKVRMHSSLR